MYSARDKRGKRANIINSKNSGRYRVINRKAACENSQFEVFFDDIEEANGSLVYDYLIVAPRRKAANLVTGVGVLPIVDGKYALLKIYRHAIAGYSWEIPRGFIENDETVIESVMRELKEETGLYCEKRKIRSLGYITPEAGIVAARINLFVATECLIDKSFVANETGHQDLKLFDGAEMASGVKDSVIQDPCTLIAYYRYVSQRSAKPFKH